MINWNLFIKGTLEINKDRYKTKNRYKTKKHPLDWSPKNQCKYKINVNIGKLQRAKIIAPSCGKERERITNKYIRLPKTKHSQG